MPDFGFCYDSAQRCTSGPQVGTTNLRNVTQEFVPEVGSYGIFNCRSSRTGKSLSLHGEGRAWDAAIPWGMTALGNRLAQFYVDQAQRLGVQRVIWGFGYGALAKEWDSRQGERYWESYSGPAHDDHIHVELCWAAARGLTSQQVRDVFDRYWTGEGGELDKEERQLLEQAAEDAKAARDAAEDARTLAHQIKNADEKNSRLGRIVRRLAGHYNIPFD